MTAAVADHATERNAQLPQCECFNPCTHRLPFRNSKSSIMSKTSDSYVKVVAWSEEDQCYVGRCPGLMLGGVHGSDERAVYAELCEAVDEWIRLHEAEG